MGWPVILTPQSRDDLKRIVSYIARYNQERARSFGYELIDRALNLGAFPESGEPCQKSTIQLCAK
jgi:plasmid stabilization system protein ParE